MNLLQTVGVMALVFGMQITFEAEPRAEFVSLVEVAMKNGAVEQ